MTPHTPAVPASIIPSFARWALFFSAISLLSTGCKPQAEDQIPPQKYTIPGPVPEPVLSQHGKEKADKNDPSKENNSAATKLWTPAQNRPWTELDFAHDTWDLCFMQESRIGYVRNRITPITLDDGQKVVKTESFSRLQMQRFGQTTKIDFIIESTESPRGELIAFTEVMKNGPTPNAPAPAPQTTHAHVEGDRLQFITKGVDKSFPWSPEFGGFNAVAHSLLSSPMKPGNRRRLRHLVPMFDTIATTDLIAQTVEPVKLLHGTFRLLRIDTITTLPDGTQISGVAWTDTKGQQLKTYTKLLDQETYRVTREEALAQYKPGQIDLGFDMLVKPDRPIENPHDLTTREQSYLVTLEGADPAMVFTTGASQSVEPINANTARVTVRAIRPGPKKITAKGTGSFYRNGQKPDNTSNKRCLPPFPGSDSDPPTMADLNPNRYIESNDPAVRAMAKEATKDQEKGTGSGAWEKAVAAERYVHDNLAKADYSQVFSTAAETAKSKRGDCSEHAVLLAALGRSLGIPSRVVVGLVYSKPLGAFGFHMWTEMYLEGTWIPMDATLGRGGIGVGHLKLGHTTLQNGLADSVFFALPKTLGKLKIKVE